MFQKADDIIATFLIIPFMLWFGSVGMFEYGGHCGVNAKCVVETAADCYNTGCANSDIEPLNIRLPIGSGNQNDNANVSVKETDRKEKEVTNE